MILYQSNIKNHPQKSTKGSEKMAGYKGYSMSNNAVDAYNNGEKPKSKWTKEEIVSLRARPYDAIAILLKGVTDVIVHNDRKKINNTGTAAMTHGGTGDVLSGIVAGLVSKGMNMFDAACLGAYINGSAGEMAFDEKSYGLVATDVIETSLTPRAPV